MGLLFACGGGGTISQAGDGWQVSSGLAQKGPLLRGSSVTVAELSTTTLQPSGKTYPFEVLDDSGTFKPTNITFTSSYLESTAQGYYFNELTGAKSSDMVFLRGLSNLATGQDTAVNVNVLSSFTDQRIRNLFNTVPKKTFAVARPQAEKELLAGFYIYNAVDLMPGTTVGGVVQPKSFMEMDLSKKRASDQILAAISAVVVTAGQTGSGVNYLINQIETDLADDGLLNNSTKFPVSVASQLNAAVQTTDFAAAARNLNAFYGTTYTSTDLSQWLDTSGGVDQVIDKFKFIFTNVQSGVESKSPIYIASTDDVGQCFTVTNGKLYKANVFQASPIKATKGDSFSVGLIGSGTAFIQRFSAVNGLCPSTAPNTGTIRIVKYSTNGLRSAGSLVKDYTNGLTWVSDTNLFGTLSAKNPNYNAYIAGIFSSSEGKIQDINGVHNLTISDFDQYNNNMSWWGARAFVNYLNSMKYQGFSDWRLPNDIEISRLFYSQLGQVLGQPITTTHNGDYSLFQNVQWGIIQTGTYWTSNDLGAIVKFYAATDISPGVIGVYYKNGAYATMITRTGIQ